MSKLFLTRLCLKKVSPTKNKVKYCLNDSAKFGNYKSYIVLAPSRVARFFGTIYQHGEKYTKLTQNIPNVHTIYQMSLKYTKCS
jgi:hypothetical protein